MAGAKGKHRRARPHRLRRPLGAAAAVVVAAAAVAAGFAGCAGRAAPRAARPASRPGPTVPAATTSLPETRPGPGGVTARWVQEENARPGSDAWRISRPAAARQIAGYASRASIDAGGSVDLYVSTSAPTFHVQAFRMGWYGGKKGRLVWTSPSVPGGAQPPCPVTPAVRMVECSWTHPLSVSTDRTGWPPGDYLFLLTASTGWQSYVPLTIRDDASHSAYLVNNSVTTWQAYNTFGGYDLYEGAAARGEKPMAARSYVVSFDRPYAFSEGEGQGAADFLGLELPVVAMAESLGLDVSYTTDIDLNEHPSLLEQHRAFVSLGHDEYYSLAMRNGVQAARDAGVNLAFLGANAIYRPIRLQPSPLGPDREEVDYKNPSLDPLRGKNNAEVTAGSWRAPPNNAPESAILGEMWACNPVSAPMVITDAGAWVFAGTGLTDGSKIPGIVGPEFDHYTPGPPAPADVTVLARSPVVCDGRHQEADMTYYSAPSGAGVWDTGTIDWVGSLGPDCPGCPPPGPATGVTANVFAAFGAGPAGRAHPSQANTAAPPPARG